MLNMNAIDSGPLEDGGYRYVREYTSIPYVNAFISIYLISLGDFSYLEYLNNEEGGNGMAWFFFILASFVVLIVFMNMLIAIMADTFANVKSAWLESK